MSYLNFYRAIVWDMKNVVKAKCYWHTQAFRHFVISEGGDIKKTIFSLQNKRIGTFTSTKTLPSEINRLRISLNKLQRYPISVYL